MSDLLDLHARYNGLPSETGNTGSWFEDFDSGLPSFIVPHVGDPNITGSDTWMLAANVTVSSSKCIITLKQEASNGRNYTSGRITTRGLRAFKRGLIEVNAKYPYGVGIWSTIWMLPQFSIYGAWPRSGEIDICEHPGPNASGGANPYYENNYSCGVHFGDADQSLGGKNTVGFNMNAGFHTYGLLWNSESMTFLCDGNVVRTIAGGWTCSSGAFPAPFNQPFDLRIDSVVNGTWAGPPDGSTVLPQTMEIDWIRYTPL